jgi:two-component system KDP operon response regulator KdpE
MSWETGYEKTDSAIDTSDIPLWPSRWGHALRRAEADGGGDVMEQRLLIAHENPEIAGLLRHTFQNEQFSIDTAEDGPGALRRLLERRFDGAIVSHDLPQIDTLSMVSEARRKSNIPIIVISERQDEEDHAAVLDAGANDVVALPLRLRELSARLRAAMRGAPTPGRDRIRIAHLTIDFVNRVMLFKDKEVRPSPKEWRLLRAFADHLDDVLTYRQIVDAVWGSGEAVEMQSVRVLVGHLRMKVEMDPANPKLIRTEHGIGYRLHLPK